MCEAAGTWGIFKTPLKPLPEGYAPLTTEQREEQEARLDTMRHEQFKIDMTVKPEHGCLNGVDIRQCEGCKAGTPLPTAEELDNPGDFDLYVKRTCGDCRSKLCDECEGRFYL